MRRMIHNTTAIVTCLSLLVPSVALAQAPASEDEIKKLEEQLSEKVEEGQQAVEEQVAPAAEPAEAPAAEAPVAPEETPVAAEPESAPAEPVAEEALAPAAADEAPAVAPEAAAEETPAPAAAVEAPVAEEAPAAAEPEATAEEVPAPEAAPEAPVAEETPETAEPATTPEDAPAAVVEEAPSSEPTGAPEETAPTEDAPAAVEPAAEAGESPNALEKALAAEAAKEKPAAAETAPAEATASEPATAEPETTEPKAAATPAETAPAAEAPAAVTEEKPADSAASTTPTAPAAQTEASKEAASGTPAAAVSALDDEASGEVVSQDVTKDDARTSDEDFATSLSEALTQAENPQAVQEASDDNDDDKNDLAKALLLGLGGVAVGAMLANNRQVELSTPDRVVVTRPDGSQEIIKDEVALLRQPGSTVSTENFDDGSSRTIVTREDGSKVVTIRDANLQVLRRTLISADGQSTALIDDTQSIEPVDIATLPAAAAPITGSLDDEEALRDALMSETAIDRQFTLGQIRNIAEVRSLVAPVNIDAITFETGSAAISPDQAKQLSSLGNVIQQTIADNPQEIFLIEGHTDAVGSNAMNLALSDRRAESVALALSEYFKVPAENLVVQGYGEQFPKVQSDGDVRENRRASVRRITELLQSSN